MPSSPGITTSSSTTSGGSAASAVSAAKPLSTSVVRWPSLSRLFVRTRRFNGSSSTMRMCPGRACIGSPASGATGVATESNEGPPSAGGVSHAVRGPSNTDRSIASSRQSSQPFPDARGIDEVLLGLVAGECVLERIARAGEVTPRLVDGGKRRPCLTAIEWQCGRGEDRERLPDQPLRPIELAPVNQDRSHRRPPHALSVGIVRGSKLPARTAELLGFVVPALIGKQGAK